MAAPGSYSLKWHGHGLHVNASVSSLYKSESFTDLVLATTDGRYFPAHQFVMSSCSQYLQKMIMIGSSFKSLSKVVVILPPEIKYSTLNILLQYIYKGEAVVNHEQIPNVMKAAELLQISGLCLGKDKTPTIVDMLNNSPCSEHTSKSQNKNSPSLAEHKNTRETTKINHRVLIPEVKYSEPEVVMANDVNDNNSKSSSTSNVNKPHPSKSLSPARKKIKESCDNSLDVPIDSKCHRSTVDDMIEEVIVEEEIHIKDEPIDWGEQKSNDETDGFFKEEVLSEDGEVEKESCYVPLTCDLCHETFTTPSLWVRHIEESHPFTALASGRLNSVQKEESGVEYPNLNCELCQQVFDVPAEWVRHIQSHTEQQLAQENDLALSAADNSRGRIECSVCGKILQSQASMQIHARTHTGERPYLCKVCGREFNVKSNYLRHLRTLHDQLVHPSLIESFTTT